MARPLSKVAPQWWDYTTLDTAILEDAARMACFVFHQGDRIWLGLSGLFGACSVWRDRLMWPILD